MSGNKQFCIAIAENDGIVRHRLAELLRQRAYRVVEARDGWEAFNLVDQHGDSINLLITDYEMPRMSGFELAQRLKAKNSDLRILLTSGTKHEAGHPFDASLRKPYQAGILADKVRQLLDLGSS